MCTSNGVDTVIDPPVNGETWSIRSAAEDFSAAAARGKSHLKLADD